MPRSNTRNIDTYEAQQIGHGHMRARVLFCAMAGLLLATLGPLAQAETKAYTKIALGLASPTEVPVLEIGDSGFVGLALGTVFDELWGIELEYAHLWSGDDFHAPQFMANAFFFLPLGDLPFKTYVGGGGGLMLDIRDEAVIFGSKVKLDDDYKLLGGIQIFGGIDVPMGADSAIGVDMRYQYFEYVEDRLDVCVFTEIGLPCGFVAVSLDRLRFFQLSAHYKWR